MKKLNINVLTYTFVYFSIQSPLTLRHFVLGTSSCISSSYHVTSWLFNQNPSGLHHLWSVYHQGLVLLLHHHHHHHHHLLHLLLLLLLLLLILRGLGRFSLFRLQIVVVSIFSCVFLGSIFLVVYNLKLPCVFYFLSFKVSGKSPTLPSPDYTEDARRFSNGIAHAARLVTAGQYADVQGRATEQYHSRACLFGKIT